MGHRQLEMDIVVFFSVLLVIFTFFTMFFIFSKELEWKRNPSDGSLISEFLLKDGRLSPNLPD